MASAQYALTMQLPPPAEEITRTLRLDRNRDRWGRMRNWGVRRWLIAGAGVAIVIAGSIWFLRSNDPDPGFRLAEVTRGALVVEITATGTLQPVDQVDVGSELSGMVEWVGVDYNDRVKAGQVIARLDNEELKARVVQGRATLASATARVAENEATVEESELRLTRCLKLLEKQMCTQETADNARAGATRAKAGLASAAAQVEVAQATLSADETKLKKAVIVAPIDGIVLTRNIAPGQTVAAVMTTPILFTLAEDLSRLELHVDVDEADVGQVQVGQRATFTVDAHPNRTFDAEIVQVRFAPKTVQGVVTYETLLSLDNRDLVLRPGMTATAEVVVARLAEALLVPNAALRFRLPEQVEDRRSAVQKLMPRSPFRSRGKPEPEAKQGAGSEVWVLRDGKPLANAVVVGATDGRLTEVLGGDLTVGDEVIVGVAETRP